MKAPLSLMLVLGCALAAPAPSDACPGTPSVAEARPPDRSVVLPKEGWALFEVPGHGRGTPWRAEVFDQGGRRRSTPDVISLGPDHVAVLLARLRPGVQLQLHLSLDGAQLFNVPIVNDGRYDHVGPTTPEVLELFARPAEPTPCDDSGWWVHARFTASQDERAVSGYLLLEQDDRGQWVSVGAALHPLTDNSAALELVTLVPRDGRHCYKLAAVDYAVNISRPSDPVCLDFNARPFDAGVPQDAGPADASGQVDAGDAPDAGLSAQPASQPPSSDSGCRCLLPQSTDNRPALLSLAALFGLALRRSARRRRRAP